MIVTFKSLSVKSVININTECKYGLLKSKVFYSFHSEFLTSSAEVDD